MGTFGRIGRKIFLLLLVMVGISAFFNMIRSDAEIFEAMSILLGSFPFAGLVCDILQKISEGSNNEYTQYLSYLSAFCTSSMIASIIKTFLTDLLKPAARMIIQALLVPVRFSDWEDAERYMDSAGYHLLIAFWETVTFPFLILGVNWIMAWAENWINQQFGAWASLILGASGGTLIAALTLLLSFIQAKVGHISFWKMLKAKSVFTLAQSLLDVLVRDFLCFALYTSVIAGAAAEPLKWLFFLFLWLLLVDWVMNCLAHVIAR